MRAQFPLDPAISQFAAFVLSPQVRAAAAEFAGGTPRQYAPTDSTTMGLAITYGGLALEPATRC